MTAIPKPIRKKKRKKKRWTKQRIRRVWIDAILDCWSILVKHRDNYTCQWCGAVNAIFNAHHIVPKGVLHNKLAGYIALENGVTLCKGCHFRAHYGDADIYNEFRDKYTNNSYKEMKDFYLMKTKYSTDDLKLMYNLSFKLNVLNLGTEYQEKIDKIDKKLSKIGDQ